MPKISVIIPAYNAEKYIDQCIQSVLDQTYSDFELIVVDDGSTDSTVEKLNGYAGNDQRVRVLTQQNQYAGVARNNGIEHAQGEYLYFLDADDYIAPNLLERMVGRIEETSADIVVCKTWNYMSDSDQVVPLENCLVMVDTDKVYSRDELTDVMFRFCAGWPWDKVYSASFIKQNNLQFLSLRYAEDAYFVFCALMLARHVAFVPEELVYHRTHVATSLESTRSESPTDAITSMLLIRERMEKEGLYQMFERSYWNWVATFSIWNLVTLDDKSFEAFRAEFVDRILPQMPMDDPDYYYEYYDWEAVKSTARSRYDIYSDLVWKQEDDLATHRELWKTQSELDGLNRDISERSERLGREIEAARAELKQAEADRDAAESDLRDLMNSKTYRAGKVIAAPLNAVRKLKH